MLLCNQTGCTNTSKMATYLYSSHVYRPEKEENGVQSSNTYLPKEYNNNALACIHTTMTSVNCWALKCFVVAIPPWIIEPFWKSFEFIATYKPCLQSKVGRVVVGPKREYFVSWNMAQKPRPIIINAYVHTYTTSYVKWAVVYASTRRFELNWRFFFSPLSPSLQESSKIVCVEIFEIFYRYVGVVDK